MTAQNAPVIKENKEELLELLPEGFKWEVYLHTSEQMPEVDDESVDLVVTSPPYPMIELWDYLGSYDEQHEMIKKVMSECYDKLKRGGIMCINIGDATRSKSTEFRYYPNHARITENAEEIGFSSLIPILWNKPQNSPNKFMGSGMKPPNAYVTNETEYILIFRKKGPRKFENSLLRNASQYSTDQRNEWFSQIWDIRGAPQRDELSQFPFEIPYRLIRMFSVMGDTVLDPFCGTGTTLQASRSLGRHGIGFELNEELVDDIENKMSKVDSIPTEDILVNMVRVDRDGSGPETFIKNPQPLIDIL